jgi:glycosyltransferase involved in cell wall biosynthesis
VKILHVITGLYTGGAEMMLAKLVERMASGNDESAVISLTKGGPLADSIAASGIPVTLLDMPRAGRSVPGFVRLVRAMRRHKPDLVQSWMYHANLLAGLAAKFAGRPPVIWGIRQSDLDPRISKPSTIAVARMGARCSRWLPRKVVCCAESARVVHEAMGYAPERMLVIPNGFDLDRFHPDTEARRALHGELGLPDTALLVGLAARCDPQKDHGSFLTAAGILHRQNPNAHFVLCGDGIDRTNTTLAGWIADQGIGAATHLLGQRTDMARIMAGCDVMVSSSAFGEGFPNVLGEAMAAGTPCVATGVGDSALIVGNTGRVVPPRDPSALAAALRDILTLSRGERRALGEQARVRVAEHYSIDAVTARYSALYHATLAGTN